MSDIHSRTVHKNPCAWHVTHWQSTAEVRETGSSQRISFPALHLAKTANLQRSISNREQKFAITGRIQTGSYTNRDGQKIYTTDVVIEEQEFAESKKAAGEQEQNAGYTDAGDGFMNIPDVLTNNSLLTINWKGGAVIIWNYEHREKT